MRKIIATMLLVMAGMTAYAALPGTTCYTAKELGKDFRENITGSSVVWYSAWTFDLPLSVYFVPQNETDPKPEVEMDFSCTSGVYTDSIICSLFCKNSGSGIQLDMPHRPALKTGTTDDGKLCYYLAIGKEYRDLLLKTGIDYNVQVFVKVTYKSAGVISIAPDDMFTNCMDGARFMHFGDTIKVRSKDKSRHVIVPYVQWQDDSIRYVWEGENDCRIAIANKCEFDPTDATDGSIIDAANLKAGKDTLKVTSKLLHDYVSSPEYPNEAGMYFVKWYSEGPGVLKVENIPMAPPQGGATLLRYDKTVAVTGDISQLFAIPYTWDTAVIFTTPTDHIFRMYIGTTHDFQKESAIASYQFSAGDAGHWLGIPAADMKALWTHTTEQYLYIRFECTAKTNLTPSLWEMSECEGKTIPLHRPSTTVDVEKGSYGAVYYRFYYREWVGGDMTFEWLTNASTCPTFIGDNCTFTANKYDEHVITNQTIAKKGTWSIPAATVAKWEKRVDDDGYLYIRFNPGSQGTMVISTTAPEEVDPAPITYPAATISVLCNGEPTADGQAYIVRVSAEQDLSLYPGEPTDIASRTPIETWHQTPAETHALTLTSGVYTLKGIDETIRLIVK